MKERDYLEQALTLGLMFCSHPVSYRPLPNDRHEINKIVEEELLPLILQKVASLPGDVHLPPEVMRLFGPQTINIPMICFTEAYGARNLDEQYNQFGEYGVVVTHKWLEDNGGDRVLYVGSESQLTKHLCHLYWKALIGSIHKTKDNKALPSTQVTQKFLTILAYIETRKHLSEAEWRIADATSIYEGNSKTGTRIALPLSAIRMVIVQSQEDIEFFEHILKSRPDFNATQGVPPIRVLPPNLTVAFEDVPDSQTDPMTLYS